jgi:uncharacterized RDD family membrane protein YckC
MAGGTPKRRRRDRRRERRSKQLRNRARPDRIALRSNRMAAAIVDALFVTLVLTALAWIVMGISASVGVDLNDETALGILAVVIVVMGILYTLIPTALWGQTLGKRLAGIRVVRSDNFDVPGWRRAAIRTLGLTPLGWMPYGNAAVAAGESMFMFTRTRQGLHDLIAGTVVVDDREWRRWASRESHRSANRTSTKGGVGK